MIIAVLLCVVLNGCAKRQVLPPPPQPGYPLETLPDQTTIPRGYSSGPANALYEDATQSMAEGAFNKAELSLERALRIEPSNPYYWYTMGKIKYRQGANAQAIQFCLKSKSLAGRDAKLVSLNDDLIMRIQQDSNL
jgi:predicted Zn-dependent protease